MTRIVSTHSTIIAELAKLLAKLAKVNDNIKLIVPGRMYHSPATINRAFAVKITKSVEDGSSFKILARKGSQVQEVFIVPKPAVSLSVKDLDITLQKIIKKEKLS